MTSAARRHNHYNKSGLSASSSGQPMEGGTSDVPERVERARVWWVVRLRILLLGVCVEYIFIYNYMHLDGVHRSYPWLLNTESQLQNNEVRPSGLTINEHHLPLDAGIRASFLPAQDHLHGLHSEAQA